MDANNYCGEARDRDARDDSHDDDGREANGPRIKHTPRRTLRPRSQMPIEDRVAQLESMLTLANNKLIELTAEKRLTSSQLATHEEAIEKINLLSTGYAERLRQVEATCQEHNNSIRERLH